MVRLDADTQAWESPEDFLRPEARGGVLPLGGEPTVKTARAGPLQPAPPAGGAAGVRLSPTTRAGPKAAFSSTSDSRPALWDLHAGNTRPLPASGPVEDADDVTAPHRPKAWSWSPRQRVYRWSCDLGGSAAMVLLAGGPSSRPCWVSTCTRRGEPGGLGDSEGGTAWGGNSGSEASRRDQRWR